MKLKKMIGLLAITAMAAVMPVCAGFTQMEVHAEEQNQFAGLDDILRQMYAFYQNGDFSAFYNLYHSDAVGAYADMLEDNGLERYVVDLDGGIKAMMITMDGTYGWWYFGQVENNLRQGQGATVVTLGDGEYFLYTGSYSADFPSGEGRYTQVLNDRFIDVTGIFQGKYMNGTYQVDLKWTENGVSYLSTLPTVYENGHFKSVEADWVSLQSVYPNGEGIMYQFVGDSEDKQVYVNVAPEFEIFAVGFTPDMQHGGETSVRTARANTGFLIFEGSDNALAAIAQTSTPAPENVPEVIPESAVAPDTVPVQTPGTYIVQRGDNLSKIAKKLYGDEKGYIDIYNANKDTIKSDYTIWANQVLTIPVR